MDYCMFWFVCKFAVTQEYSKNIIKNPLEFYVHQHSWMLFVALTYDALDFLSSRSSEQKADDTYLFSARQLLVMSYNLASDYLILCLDSDDVDSVVIFNPSLTGGDSLLFVFLKSINSLQSNGLLSFSIHFGFFLYEYCCLILFV